MSENLFMKVSERESKFLKPDDIIHIIRADFDLMKGFIESHQEEFDSYVAGVGK